MIEPDELAKLRAKNDKVMTVESMVDEQAIDNRYFTEKSYYLLPEGPVANKPYAVIASAMDDKARAAVAQVVLFRRELLSGRASGRSDRTARLGYQAVLAVEFIGVRLEGSSSRRDSVAGHEPAACTLLRFRVRR